MKIVAIFATLAAITVATTAQVSAMPAGHDAGGPVKQGKYCWVDTGSHGNGWWDSCDTDPKFGLPRARSLRDVPALLASGGDGGGGGSGGGGAR